MDAADATRLVEELSRDPDLRHDAEWMRAFAGLRRHIVVADPPDAVHRAIVAEFRALPRAKGIGGVLRGLATLSFDSFARPLAHGVRGAGAVEGRQLVFSLADLDVAINLRLHGPGPTVDVTGQVLDPIVPGGGQTVHLRASEHEVLTTAADELGEFRFESVQPGSYDMVIARERVEIAIEPFDVRL